MLNKDRGFTKYLPEIDTSEATRFLHASPSLSFFPLHSSIAWALNPKEVVQLRVYTKAHTYLHSTDEKIVV